MKMKIETKVEKAFAIQQEICLLKKKLEKFKNEIKTEAKRRKLREIKSKSCLCSVMDYPITEVDTIELYENVDFDTFLECVSPVVKTCREMVTEKVFDKISFTETKKFYAIKFEKKKS